MGDKSLAQIQLGLEHSGECIRVELSAATDLVRTLLSPGEVLLCGAARWKSKERLWAARCPEPTHQGRNLVLSPPRDASPASPRHALLLCPKEGCAISIPLWMHSFHSSGYGEPRIAGTGSGFYSEVPEAAYIDSLIL